MHDKATSLNIVIDFESIQKAPEDQSTVSLKKFDCCTIIKWLLYEKTGVAAAGNLKK